MTDTIFQDIFKPRDAKEVEKKLKTAEHAMQVASDRARRCLSMEEFKAYRDSFQRASDSLLDALIAYNHQFSISDNGDLNKYAMKVNRLLTKAQDVRELLNTIDTASKRAVKKDEDE